MSTPLRQQRTLRSAVTVAGFGYWSGEDIVVEFRPAEPDSGIVFVRRDLHAANRVPARVDFRLDTPRRTTLQSGTARVDMVEHVLASLAGLQIDNCEVWVDAAEMPGFDGSSQVFITALQRAGVLSQPRGRAQLVVTEPLLVEDATGWVKAVPVDDPVCRIRYELDYGSGNPIGRQDFEMTVTTESFVSELASARTFLLKREADWLRSQGLGTRVSLADLLVFDDHGPMENELRFADECVRHKALDMVGDLALCGCDIVGQITAHRSGHRLNAEMAKLMLRKGQVRRGAADAA